MLRYVVTIGCVAEVSALLLAFCMCRVAARTDAQITRYAIPG